jgi:hypothetical protein
MAVRAIELSGLERNKHWDYVDVEIDSVRRDGADLIALRESWRLRRGAAARSRMPLEMLGLKCPACGEDVDVDDGGRCRSCSEPVAWGQTHWQLHRVTFEPPGRAVASSDGYDPVPVSSSRAVSQKLRDFKLRHPDFDQRAFLRFATRSFEQVVSTLGDGWAGVRPLVTDRALSELVARELVDGVGTTVEDVRIEGAQIVAVYEDVYYAELTVWIAGRWVRGGPEAGPTAFSVHWRFLRERLGVDVPIAAMGACPACREVGAGVSLTGVCAACGEWVTTGTHQWMVSGLSQSHTQ